MVIPITCPRCSYSIDAIVDPAYLFILYKCPQCQSNVVNYKNKVDIISDRLFLKLISKRKFKFIINKQTSKLVTATCITENQIKNLRILMETEKDFDSFLKKI